MSDIAADAPVGIIVGTATVNWNNDDLPGWRPFVPFPAILDEMAAAGYAGTEYSPAFGSDANLLRAELSSRSLRLAGSYQWLHLRDHELLEQELAALKGTIGMLLACGSSDLVVADAMTPHRIALAGHVPSDGSAGLGDDEWASLAAGLRLVCAQAAASGVRVHYHNHVGTYVETPAEVERFLEETAGDDLDLCFDTGHYAYGGGDPTAFVLDHAAEIGYMHLKDVSASVLAESRAQSWSFLEALRHIIFSEFGDGIVDIPKVIDILKANDYAGWVIVEQDTSARDNTESAKASRAYLRRACGI